MCSRSPPVTGYGVGYAGQGAYGSPFAYGGYAGWGYGGWGGGPGPAAGYPGAGYGNYGRSGFPGRVALPTYPYSGYPGPYNAKVCICPPHLEANVQWAVTVRCFSQDSGAYNEKTSGRYRLGMAEPTHSYPGDDFPVSALRAEKSCLSGNTNSTLICRL